MCSLQCNVLDIKGCTTLQPYGLMEAGLPCHLFFCFSFKKGTAMSDNHSILILLDLVAVAGR